MSQFYPIPVVAVVGLSAAMILTRGSTLPDEIVGALAVFAGLLAGGAWVVSSLPNGSRMVAKDESDD